MISSETASSIEAEGVADVAKTPVAAVAALMLCAEDAAGHAARAEPKLKSPPKMSHESQVRIGQRPGRLSFMHCSEVIRVD